MKGIIARSLGLAVSLAALSTTLLAGPAAKQPEKPQSATPLPTDWSHQHLIFSHPRTPEQAARVQKDIRYQLQQRRLTAPEASSMIKTIWDTERFRRTIARRFGDAECTVTGHVDSGANMRRLERVISQPSIRSYHCRHLWQWYATASPTSWSTVRVWRAHQTKATLLHLRICMPAARPGLSPAITGATTPAAKCLRPQYFRLDGTQLAFTQTTRRDCEPGSVEVGGV